MIDYKNLLMEFMMAVEEREGSLFVSDVLIDIKPYLTPEENEALYEVYKAY